MLIVTFLYFVVLGSFLATTGLAEQARLGGWRKRSASTFKNSVSFLESGLKFGQEYSEVDVQRGEDGSMTVNFSLPMTPDEAEGAPDVAENTDEGEGAEDDNQVEVEVPGVSGPISAVPNATDPDVKYSCLHHNKGSMSAGLSMIGDHSVDSCFDSCKKEPKCSHWTYNLKTKYCYLKEGVPSLRSVASDITGARTCDTSCFRWGITYTGAEDVAEGSTTDLPTDCQASCQATPECKAFYWTKNERKCHLVGEPGFTRHRQINQDGAVAGPKHACDTGATLQTVEDEDSQALNQAA